MAKNYSNRPAPGMPIRILKNYGVFTKEGQIMRIQSMDNIFFFGQTGESNGLIVKYPRNMPYKLLT